ncbi:MAG: ABC transporter substrate-binding protein [Bauldia sp.]
MALRCPSSRRPRCPRWPPPANCPARRTPRSTGASSKAPSSASSAASTPPCANINALAPEIEKLTGINLTVEQIAWDAYAQKVQLDLGSPQPQYDMFLCNGGDFDWAYGPSGNLSEIQQFLDDAALTDQAWYDLADVDPKIVAAASWDGVPDHRQGTGKPHVVPFMSESYMLSYRDDILQKHNVTPPTTLEELLVAAKAVYDGEGGSFPRLLGRAPTPTAASSLRCSSTCCRTTAPATSTPTAIRCWPPMPAFASTTS